MNILNASDYRRHPAVSIDCPACGKSALGFVYSRAFSVDEEILCDRCGTQRLLAHAGPVFDFSRRGYSS